MKFTLSTQPLADALNLGVIPGNISKYFQVSCLAQLTATKTQLRVNLQANNLSTEILLKGQGDVDEEAAAFVDCLVLKQIVGTFETPTITLEYIEGGLVLHSGTYQCTLPYLADAEDGELVRPQLPASDAAKVKLNLADWKFVKDFQMYSAALSFVHPIYQNAWLGEAGDVIVGDFDNSLFTFSKKNKLGKTCLLTDTIINLINSLPEGADITMMDTSYRIDVKTDTFEYASEFRPKYEGEEGVGSYQAEAIMGAIQKEEDKSFKVPVASLAKFLNQSDILSSGSNNKITFTLAGNTLEVKDDNVDAKIKVDGGGYDFSIPLNIDLFKPVISHVDADIVTVCPAMNEGEPSGLVIWTDNLTVVVGAVEEEM